MQKKLLVLALAALTVMASAGDVFAQGRGGRGGVSVRFGTGGGYRGGYYGGRNYYGGRGYYGNSLYLGTGGYYGSGYGSYYSPYYSSPGYYSNSVVQVPATDIRQSFYAEPAQNQQTATINVIVPMANAIVWFDGVQTAQQGTQRTFHSPALESGYNYSYTIRARWTENGNTVNRERRVNVQPGQSMRVDFRSNSEAVPAPLPRGE